MQVLGRTHTTNTIDVKIEPQSVLIMKNFSITFFDVRSAFKGRIQPFLAMNLWLTCVDWCRLESRTQENHEELKIFLQCRLISSRFNQELSLQRKNINFYTKNRAKIMHRPIRWRMIQWLRLHDIDGPWSHVSYFFPVRSSSKRLDASMCPPTMSQMRK